jgi:uncharacterized protein
MHHDLRMSRLHIEPISKTSPRPVRRALTIQRWEDVAFVHWAVEPGVVAPLLPAGTDPDTLDGVTYVGLIAFRMVDVGALGAPGLPYLGSFPETNVRLYSVDAAGRRGIVFCSMDAARLLPVLAGHAAGLPYRWARMAIRVHGDCWTYTSCSHIGLRPAARNTLAVRVGHGVSASPLDDFLTARWGLHLRRAGRLWYWPVEHPAWQLHSAEIVSYAGNLIDSAGIGLPPAAPVVSVRWSPGVPARFGPPLPAPSRPTGAL